MHDRDYLKEIFDLRRGAQPGSSAAQLAEIAEELWALRRPTWTAFSDAMPEPRRLLLVTNNLEARDEKGLVCVWLVWRAWLYGGEGEAAAEGREPVRFDVQGLTHWRYALPEDVGTQEVK